MRFSRAMISLAMALVIGVPVLAAQGNEGKVKAVLQSGPDVGRRAPDFSLPWASKDSVGPIESPYQLASDRGKTVVIAFYPRDFTQSSTAEMRTLAQQYDSLAGPDVVLVAISTDSVPTHRRFAQSLNLPFRLLSDPDQRISKQYASKDPNGYNRRTVYVVGPDGRVAFRNLQFNALDPKDYAELRNAVKNSLRRS